MTSKQLLSPNEKYLTVSVDISKQQLSTEEKMQLLNKLSVIYGSNNGSLAFNVSNKKIEIEGTYNPNKNTSISISASNKHIKGGFTKRW